MITRFVRPTKASRNLVLSGIGCGFLTKSAMNPKSQFSILRSFSEDQKLLRLSDFPQDNKPGQPNDNSLGLKTRDDHLNEVLGGNIKEKIGKSESLNTDPNSNHVYDSEYDVLIVGGGSTGAGSVLAAANKGLKALCIDSADFSSGASSKSSKLIHGGVRYLQTAFSLDPSAKRRECFELVKESTEERENLVNNAPHLTRYLSTVIPCKNIFYAIYYYIGMKFYTAIAPVDKKHMFGCPKPFLIGENELRARFPLVSLKYKWGVVYYDGEMDDSRVNVEALLTSTLENYVEGFQPANILNYTKLQGIIKNKDGIIEGALIRDKATNTDIKVKCKAIINASGFAADTVRRMDDPFAKTRIVHARGSHVVLDRSFCPRDYGVLLPSTSDGRVMFILPWMSGTMVGTTDDMIKEGVLHPVPESSDLNWIMTELSDFYPKLKELNTNDLIKSNWSGIRPLVLDDAAQNDPSIMTKTGELRENIKTSKLSRLHVLERSKSGLISIMGGKWTIFRKMGEDAVNSALDHIKEHKLKKDLTPDQFEAIRKRSTYYLPLMGDYRVRTVSQNDFDEKIDQKVYLKTLVNKLEQKKVIDDLGYLNYLSRSYGRRAFDILNLIAEDRELKERIHPSHHLTKAEVMYLAKYEQVVTPLDILLRRSRIGFVDAKGAEESLPQVIDIMGSLQDWDDSKKRAEYDSNLEFLLKMRFANVNSSGNSNL